MTVRSGSFFRLQGPLSAAEYGALRGDASLASEDLHALTMTDPDATCEQRFISIGSDPLGRVPMTFLPRGRRKVGLPRRQRSRPSVHPRRSVSSAAARAQARGGTQGSAAARAPSPSARLSKARR
jgi:hypothetical protein